MRRKSLLPIQLSRPLFPVCPFQAYRFMHQIGEAISDTQKVNICEKTAVAAAFGALGGFLCSSQDHGTVAA